MSNKTEKTSKKQGLEMKYKVGDLVVPADGSSYVGEITYISQEEDTVRHKCLKTGTEYEKSYYGFPVRYMSIVEMLEWSKKLSKENTDLHTKLILATEQGQAQDRALNGLQMMTEFATADLTRMETARGERDEARHWLGELLAVIHGDGGHHTEAVGVSQSVSDAHAVWAALVAERDTSRTETNKARTAVVTRVEGTDFDFRWRQDETPVDALIRQRNEAWAELARLTRAGAAINWDPHREDEARWVAVMKQRHARGQEHVCGLADVLRTLEERDELRHKLAGEAAHIKSLEGLLVDAVRERDELKTRLAHAEADAEQAIHNKALNERRKIAAWLRALLAHLTLDSRTTMQALDALRTAANAIEQGEHER